MSFGSRERGICVSGGRAVLTLVEVCRAVSSVASGEGFVFCSDVLGPRLGHRGRLLLGKLPPLYIGIISFMVDRLLDLRFLLPGWHHCAVKSEVDRRIAAIDDGLGIPCGRARGETQRVRPGLCQGRSTDEDDASRDGRTKHRRPQHVP